VPLIVTTSFDHTPVTPVGKPLKFALVAPVVLYVILVIAVFIHNVCESVPDAALKVIVLSGFTYTVPVAVAGTQPPVVVTVYVYVPAAVGVPLIVYTFADHTPLIPGGKPITVALVAILVVYLILVDDVFIHTVCESVPVADVNVIASLGFTFILPLFVIIPHPPVNVIV
jgi:hypothetical protein